MEIGELIIVSSNNGTEFIGKYRGTQGIDVILLDDALGIAIGQQKVKFPNGRVMAVPYPVLSPLHFCIEPLGQTPIRWTFYYPLSNQPKETADMAKKKYEEMIAQLKAGRQQAYGTVSIHSPAELPPLKGENILVR